MILGAVVAVAVATLLVRRELHLWLFAYLRQRIAARFRKSPAGRHFIIAICDHFDFGSAGELLPGERGILDIWERRYPPLSDRHRDSGGVNLKHTWFFPAHYHRADHLERLVGLCRRGYGEIEMHLHHDHMPPFPDTSETLREKVRATVEAYAQHDVFVLPDGSRTFAFIHGDWALDNSRGGKYCGVNDEIRILAEQGCYADFTFPSLHESQPRQINTVYYVADDPGRPKSYDRGVDARVGGSASGDLMLIQGPLALRRKKKFGFPFFPAIEAAELEGNSRPSMERFDSWVKAGVHVKGRPEWVFIKLHTHGAMATNYEHNLGEIADCFFDELEERFQDPREGYLHYVTAREMYNIVKAAEAGETGNPGAYRDYLVPRYRYLPQEERRDAAGQHHHSHV